MTVSKTLIIIVAFRNGYDVKACLKALSALDEGAPFEVFIVENGGPAAMEALVETLLGSVDICRECSTRELSLQTSFVRRRTFELLGARGEPSGLIHVAEAAENLGYAGGVNAWLQPLMGCSAWENAWVLNPDTEPAPDSLLKLESYARLNRKRMVGGRLVPMDEREHEHSRGLAWRKLTASSLAVDFHAPLVPAPDPRDVESRIDSPSGASIFITRDLVEEIGLMDESYFLFFEDLEWGARAKKKNALGYAHDAVVRHKGGTTIGTGKSDFSFYLEFRNRILFVRKHHPGWLPWTVMMQFVHILRLCGKRQLKNALAGLKGLLAALRGETGRPEHLLSAHLMREGGGSKEQLKVLLSGAYLLARRGLERLAQTCGSSPVETFVVLYYHSVPSEKRASFARQMDILARCANVVTADWRGSPVGRPCVAITFDDAFTNVIDNALPELAMRGFPCTIFAPSGVLGRHPDWAMEGNSDRGELIADAETLKKIHGPLVTIGSHSVTHPRLSQIDIERAQAEINDSRVALEEIVGAPIDLLAFPYGDYNDTIVELCRSDGYRHVFTISPNCVPAGDSTVKRGRVSVSPDDGEYEFFLKMSGAYAWMPAASALKRCLATLTGALHS